MAATPASDTQRHCATQRFVRWAAKEGFWWGCEQTAGAAHACIHALGRACPSVAWEPVLHAHPRP